MTITCTCPKCDRFCGFKDAYAGRQVRCLACNSHFIIPNHDGQTAQLVKPEPKAALPGFYRATLVDNFKVFIQKESLFGIILCIGLTGFHFFAGDKDYSFTLGGFRPPLIIGWFVTFCCAGYLLWYFMEIINRTTTGDDFLPEIFIGAGFSFVWQAVKSIYLFIVAFAIAAIPGAALTTLLKTTSISNRWTDIIIIVLSLSMLPMIVCLLGSGTAEWNLFRYDRIVRLIAKTPAPYLLTAMITFTGLGGIILTAGLFSDQTNGELTKVAGMFALRLAAVFVMLFSMRTLGLYARHYSGCFPQLFELK